MTTQVACSVKCALLLAQKKRQKEVKQNDKIRKAKLKKKSDYRSEAQSAFNSFIRIRDSNKLCVSCDSILFNGQLGGGFDAGHYRSRGAASHLSFNLFNVHGQCKRCNRYLGGNYSEYRIRLIDRIGLDRVENLEINNSVVSFSNEYLERVKKIFSKRARLYKRRFR